MDVRAMNNTRLSRTGAAFHPVPTPLKLGLLYDINACRDATGVTRHALALVTRLGKRQDVDLRVVSGRINEADGLAFWESLGEIRRAELPISTRDALRFWRVAGWPPAEWWTGSVDWVYSPAEYLIPTKSARLAVTSHDALQDASYGSDRRKNMLRTLFTRADLVLSVSEFNTERLEEFFPMTVGKIAQVANAADELFFEPASVRERAAIRADLGIPSTMPYLLSVANFQPRKNLDRLIRVAARLPEVARGEMALILLGSGSPAEADSLRETARASGMKAVIRMPGYRQGKLLRAAYAEATALMFPSLCESFGIPAVEAMASGCPVALSNSTALPEVGRDAAWYFDPTNDEDMLAALRSLLDQPSLRATRVAHGREVARDYHWNRATDMLLEALNTPSRR